MIIYQAQKSEFLHDVHHWDIEDVILEAYRARTGHKVSPQEIKAWAHAHKTPLDAVVTTAFKGGQQQVNHLSYQAWSYAALLENFNAAVEDHAIRLSPCAYLHNYSDSDRDVFCRYRAVWSDVIRAQSPCGEGLYAGSSRHSGGVQHARRICH